MSWVRIVQRQVTIGGNVAGSYSRPPEVDRNILGSSACGTQQDSWFTPHWHAVQKKTGRFPAELKMDTDGRGAPAGPISGKPRDDLNHVQATGEIRHNLRANESGSSQAELDEKPIWTLVMFKNRIFNKRVKWCTFDTSAGEKCISTRLTVTYQLLRSTRRRQERYLGMALTWESWPMSLVSRKQEWNTTCDGCMFLCLSGP